VAVDGPAVRLDAVHFVIDVHFAFNSRDGFVSVSTWSLVIGYLVSSFSQSLMCLKAYSFHLELIFTSFNRVAGNVKACEQRIIY
jgi:hypothetical protein